MMQFPYEVNDFDDIREGDRIEITFLSTGDVVTTNVNRIARRSESRRSPSDAIHTPWGIFGRAVINTSWSARILSRQGTAFKVGDEIKGTEVCSLPSGSVVRRMPRVRTSADAPGNAKSPDWVWMVQHDFMYGTNFVQRDDDHKITHETLSSQKYIIEYINSRGVMPS